MNSKEQLLREIDEIPEFLLSQLLDFTLFIKARYLKNSSLKAKRTNVIASKLNDESEEDWRIEQSFSSSSMGFAAQPRIKSQVKALQEWFEATELAPDFDADNAKWEALKEKYDL